MTVNHKFPVQIQFDNQNADDSHAPMCHVFDHLSFIKMVNCLPGCWMHVIAWDADGVEVFKYDNR